MSKFVGLGSIFAFATVGSPSTYTTLAGVESISFSADKVTTAKTTDMLTTNGVDTYIGGTQDPGDCDVSLFYEPADATQTEIEAIRLATLAVNFKVTLPNGTNTRSFSGIVTSFTPKQFGLDKAVMYDLKIKLSGPWTVV